MKMGQTQMTPALSRHCENNRNAKRARVYLLARFAIFVA
jgi:hypothetical protein